MATVELSQLLGAVQTAAVHAQVKAHATLRGYVEAYASDSILRTFKIPGMEIDSIEFNLPVKTTDLSTDGSSNVGTLSLATNVIARRGRVKVANQDKVQSIFKDQLRKSDTEAKSLMDSLGTADRLIAVTSDQDFAKRLRSQLRAAEVTVDLERLEIPLQVGSLNIDTDPQSEDVTTTIFVKLKPQSYRLVEDGETEGESFTLEPVG